MSIRTCAILPFLFVLATTAGPKCAMSQTATLPAASRTVFKCVVDGRATYSDAPCLGAQRIEITPTRGMNKSTGKELTSTDVRQEQFSELLGDATRPLTGLSQEQRIRGEKRFRLPAGAKQECATLDRRIPIQEAAEADASAGDKPPAQKVLLQSRVRFRELGC
jgi:hypothetical protein